MLALVDSAVHQVLRSCRHSLWRWWKALKGAAGDWRRSHSEPVGTGRPALTGAGGCPLRSAPLRAQRTSPAQEAGKLQPAPQPQRQAQMQVQVQLQVQLQVVLTWALRQVRMHVRMQEQPRRKRESLQPVLEKQLQPLHPLHPSPQPPTPRLYQQTVDRHVLALHDQRREKWMAVRLRGRAPSRP